MRRKASAICTATIVHYDHKLDSTLICRSDGSTGFVAKVIDRTHRISAVSGVSHFAHEACRPSERQMNVMSTL